MSEWSDRTLRRLAWAGWWVTACSALLAAALPWFAPDEPPTAWGAGVIGEYAFITVVLTFAVVGLGILLRQPRNRIGWLLELVGLSWGIPGLLDAYAHYGLVIAPGSVPGPEFAAAVNEGTWTWGILTMGVFLILLFPDGHLPSPRWRPVAWAIAGVAVALPVSLMLSPGTLQEAPVTGITNPVSVPSLATATLVVNTVTLPLVPLAILASALSLAQRFRRSRGIERLQIKWLASAGVVVAALYAATLAATLGVELAGTLPVAVRVLQEMSILSFVLLPLSIGAAILRHRLFDIDVVINRALVYGSLTAILAAVYLGSVLMLQLVLRPLTNESDLVVAVSTLAVAALFRPLRARIQSEVDRRFYRARYDAARTLSAFAAHLRDELDLETLSHDLRDVVRETVHPTHVSVWVREVDR